MPVRTVMSHPLYVTDLGASVAQAIGKLSRHRIRRLPVVSEEWKCGEKQQEMMRRNGVAEAVVKFSGRAAVRGGVRKLVKNLLTATPTLVK